MKIADNPLVPKSNLSPVSEETAYAPGFGALQTKIAPQNPSVSLDRLRAAFPFLPVMLIPPSVSTVVCVNAGEAYVMSVPDGSVIGCFRSNDDFYVSKRGNASIPVVTGEDNGSLLNPDYSWFALNGVKQLSVCSPTAGAIVQLHTFVTM